MSENIENTEIEAKDDLRAELEAAMVDEPAEPTPAEESTVPEGDVPEEPVITEEPKLEPIVPPNSLKQHVKEKWETLPREVQEEIARREADIEKMMTHPEGDLNFGRTVKETITPYMAMIQAEGIKPQDAIKNLLNVAHVLNYGKPEQKSAMLRQVAQDYGVDLTVAPQQTEYQDPVIAQLLDKIDKLEQQTNPTNIQKMLQSHKEDDIIQSEINAFSSDPANKHFSAVRGLMQTLLASGQALDLRDAYDQACYANPQIRATLLNEQSVQTNEAKRKELEKKKQAAVSLSGSPATHSGNSQVNKDLDLRSMISNAYDNSNSSLI